MAILPVAVSHVVASSTDGASCEDCCTNRSGRLFNQCLADGGDAKDCDHRSALFLDSCLRDECGFEDPTPTCDSVCASQTEAQVNKCTAEGGLLELCIDQVLTSFADCVEEQCEIDLPDLPCSSTCQANAEEILNNCLEDGYDQHSCAYDALVDIHRCIARECASGATCDGACAANVHRDGMGDAVFRPTDISVKGRYDPEGRGPIDLMSTRLGAWVPANAAVDPFDGEFALDGDFVRIDIQVRGLVNPPGPLGPVTYNPYRYGFRPLYGFVEIDMDRDADTGGEIEAPLFRYLGNVARFGGLPQLPRFFNRIATDSTAFFRSFEQPPYLERNGEEFHVALLGNHITSIDEITGDGNQTFESGETWLIWGRHFHRAHGYEDFSFADGGSVPGEYAPLHPMLFSHDPSADVTWISIVFPLTQEGAAQLYDEPVQPVNPNPSDQASVFEALVDLRNSADYFSAYPTGLPEESIILGWAGKSPGDYLDPRQWSLTAIIGTSYSAPATSRAYFVWTDVYPNPVLGDVDGSGFRDEHDDAIVADWIAEYDANDGKMDHATPVPFFAGYLSVLDLNYDGIIDGGDILLSDGDADRDGDADLQDFAILQSCFGLQNPPSVCTVNDFNRNDQIDVNDASVFRWSMRGPQ